MADQARLQFLIQVSLLEAEMTDLFSQIATTVVGIVTRDAIARSQPDTAFSRADMVRLMPKLHDVIRHAFLGADSRGRQTPFEIRGSQVQPLSPYATILWRHILKVSSMAVQRHEAIIAKMLKDEPALHAAYKLIWNKKVRHIVREQEELRPRIFAGYEPAHTWVDPNGYRLSDRIWRTEEEVRRRLDLYMADAIAQGKSSTTIARELEQFLQPGQQLPVTRKPYGRNVSYNTMRLARTEIAAAANWADYEAALNNPFIAQYIPSLSNAHEVTDICDQIVDAGPYEMDDRSAVPPFHPHCLCTLLYIMKKDVDEVIDDIKAEVAREFPTRIVDGRLDIEGVQLPTITMRSPWGKQAPLFPPPLLGPVPPLLPLVPGATPSPTLPPKPESALVPSEPATPEPATPEPASSSVTALQGSGGVNQIEVDGKLSEFTVFATNGDATSELLDTATAAVRSAWAAETANAEWAEIVIANGRLGHNVVFLLDDASGLLRGIASYTLGKSPVTNRSFLTITGIASQPGTRGVGTRLMEILIRAADAKSAGISLTLPTGVEDVASFFARFGIKELPGTASMMMSATDVGLMALDFPDTVALVGYSDSFDAGLLKTTADDALAQNAISRRELAVLLDDSERAIYAPLQEALFYSGIDDVEEASIKLKQTVARRLADVLRNDEVFSAAADDLLNMMMTVENIFSFRYSPTRDVIEEVAARLVRKWAVTSGDADPLSIAIQLAANEEFGLQTIVTYFVEYKDAARLQWGRFIDDGIFGRFLRAQYNLTQEYFKELGIKEIWLWRGMQDVPTVSFGARTVYQLPDMLYGRISANPLASWSADFEIATGFGGAYSSGPMTPDLADILLAARIPVDDILAIPMYGAGCALEYEAIVLGRQRSYWVAIYKPEGQAVTKETFLEFVTGKRRL